MKISDEQIVAIVSLLGAERIRANDAEQDLKRVRDLRDELAGMLTQAKREILNLRAENTGLKMGAVEARKLHAQELAEMAVEIDARAAMAVGESDIVTISG